jgi:hypothetical protein
MSRDHRRKGDMDPAPKPSDGPVIQHPASLLQKAFATKQEESPGPESDRQPALAIGQEAGGRPGSPSLHLPTQQPVNTDPFVNKVKSEFYI